MAKRVVYESFDDKFRTHYNKLTPLESDGDMRTWGFGFFTLYEDMRFFLWWIKDDYGPYKGVYSSAEEAVRATNDESNW